MLRVHHYAKYCSCCCWVLLPSSGSTYCEEGAPSDYQRLHHYQHCDYHCYQHQHHQRIVGCPQVVPLIVRRATPSLQTTIHFSFCLQSTSLQLKPLRHLHLHFYVLPWIIIFIFILIFFLESSSIPPLSTWANSAIETRHHPPLWRQTKGKFGKNKPIFLFLPSPSNGAKGKETNYQNHPELSEPSALSASSALSSVSASLAQTTNHLCQHHHFQHQHQRLQSKLSCAIPMWRHLFQTTT